MPWTYARQKRYWRRRHDLPFLFEEEFSNTLAAVFPSPKTCQPGPGSWTVTDGDSRMSQASDNLVYAAGVSNAWDTCTLGSTVDFARRAGQFLEFEITPTTAAKDFRGGFNFRGPTDAVGINPANARNEALLWFTPGFAGTGVVNLLDGLDAIGTQYPTTLATSYLCRIYDTGTSFLYYIRTSAAGPSAWTLLWERITSLPAGVSIGPALNCHSQQATLAHLFVRQGMAKPPVLTAISTSPHTLYDGTAEMLLDFELKAPATVAGNGFRRFTFRGSDGQNYLYVMVDAKNSAMSLGKVTAGVDTNLAITNTLAFMPGSFYRIRVLAFANHLRTFYGIQPGPYADSNFNQTAALFGNCPPGGAAGFDAASPGYAYADGDIQNMRQQTGGTLLLN